MIANEILLILYFLVLKGLLCLVVLDGADLIDENYLCRNRDKVVYGLPSSYPAALVGASYIALPYCFCFYIFEYWSILGI